MLAVLPAPSVSPLMLCLYNLTVLRSSDCSSHMPLPSSKDLAMEPADPSSCNPWTVVPIISKVWGTCESLPFYEAWSQGYVWWGSGTHLGWSSSVAHWGGSHQGAICVGTPDCGTPHIERTVPPVPCCCSNSEGSVSARPLLCGLRSAGSYTGTKAWTHKHWT